MLSRIIFALCLAIITSVQIALAAPEGIAWVASWDQALAEAKASNKPIMLVAAAPQCGGVPGVW